jgi:hypothetical protein
MPKMKPSIMNQAPLRPIGLNLNIEATMSIHDPIRRDSLMTFQPEMNTQLPKYRFDIVERNNTILFYGQDNDHSGYAKSINNIDLIRLTNSIDTLTMYYYNALCYCRFENGEEFLTCRCEHSNDPWAPPPIPQHVINVAHSHHDQMLELIKKSIIVAKENNNMELISVLKEAEDATSKAIHAHNIKEPDLVETERLINTLRDALFYTLKKNSTEASNDIQSALQLVMSFHCSYHVIEDQTKIGRDDPYNMTGKVLVDDTVTPVTKALSMLTKAVNSDKHNNNEIMKLLTIALESSEKLNLKDPLLKKHLKACHSILSQESESGAEERRIKREEEHMKLKLKRQRELKLIEEKKKTLIEEKFKKRNEEINKMKQSIELRTKSYQWEQCYKHGRCEFGEPPESLETKELPIVPAPQNLPPTIDYGIQRLNGTKCELSCATTAYGNYTNCFASCKLKKCMNDKKILNMKQNDILKQIEQVSKELKSISINGRNSKLNPLLDKDSFHSNNITKKLLLNQNFINKLKVQLEALKNANEVYEKSEKVSDMCIGKWTHKQNVISLRYRNEMIRQKHLSSRRKFMKNELLHFAYESIYQYTYPILFLIFHIPHLHSLMLLIVLLIYL